MEIIKTNSPRKTVKLINNDNTVLVFALQDNEFWFEIGEYSNRKNAIKAAAKAMLKQGYTINA